MNEKWNSFLEKVKEQEFYQTLLNSYQQLSPEQQNYVKWGSVGGSLLVLMYFSWGIYSDSSSMKSEYFDKQEVLQLVNQAGDEMRRLKGKNSGFSQSTTQNWKAVFQNLASSQGVPPESVEIVKETAGAMQSMIQESLLDVQFKGIQLRPLTQLVYQIEHGTPPMKLKGMQVEGNAGDGTLNAKLFISGYMPKLEKKQ